VLAGLQRAGLEPMVVWLDAHGDFNTDETTITGYVAGMPIAMITGRGNQSRADQASRRFATSRRACTRPAACPPPR
jgi:arginase